MICLKETKVWHRTGWLLLVVLLILALMKGISLQPSEEERNETALITLSDKWEKSRNADQNALEYSYMIPDDAGEFLWLNMKIYAPEFGIYLNDTAVRKYSDKFGLNGGGQYMVQLPENAAGKVLVVRIERMNGWENWIHVDDAYLGRKEAVLFQVLHESFYALFFGIFAFLFGFGTLVLACITGKRRLAAENRSMLYLSSFIFLAGIWVVTDSKLLLFVTDKTAAVSVISFVSFMIMPVQLLKFINSIFFGKKRLVFLQRMFWVMAVFYLINYLFPIIRGAWLLFPAHVVWTVGFVILLSDGYKKMKSKRDKKTQGIMLGLVLLSIFCVAALMIFYIDPDSPYSELYSIGISFFIFCLFYTVIVKAHEQMEENANTAAYKKLAYRDTMTGLMNRTSFMKEQAIKQSVSGLGYVMLDINDLKQVNDRYGHLEGDRLIVSTAGYITDFFGKKGKCFRIGGDEFLVILENCTENETAAAVDEMQKQIEEDNRNREIALSVAVGYAMWKQKGDTPNRLFRQADASMYKNKQKHTII